MTLADGSRVDAVRNLDKSSPAPETLGENPGRSFIDPPGDGGFATAPDLVRFAHALGDGTVLDRPYAELLTGAKIPHPSAGSFGAYDDPIDRFARLGLHGPFDMQTPERLSLDALRGLTLASGSRDGLLRPGKWLSKKLASQNSGRVRLPRSGRRS